ncbi:MAG: hypothetical protein U5K69_11710 [Balneolaceae bacterium]|nr:hypothetical protein [Balneolaceae bacterium]
MVWQNIGFALGVKVLMMALAAFGITIIWAAIFADVGVALIAIANAIRIHYKYSDEGLQLYTKGSNKNEVANQMRTCETC